MLNDWSHKVRAILKEYCPGNIKKILPSLSQSGNTRFYFGHQKLCMDNNIIYFFTSQYLVFISSSYNYNVSYFNLSILNLLAQTMPLGKMNINPVSKLTRIGGISSHQSDDSPYLADIQHSDDEGDDGNANVMQPYAI